MSYLKTLFYALLGRVQIVPDYKKPAPSVEEFSKRVTEEYSDVLDMLAQ